MFWKVCMSVLLPECGSRLGNTHVDTSTKEATQEKRGIQDTVGNVTQLNVVKSTGAQVADGTKHANGAKGYEAHDGHLGPWRVVCITIAVSNATAR
jgi:hypothetical protein